MLNSNGTLFTKIFSLWNIACVQAVTYRKELNLNKRKCENKEGGAKKRWKSTNSKTSQGSEENGSALPSDASNDPFEHVYEPVKEQTRLDVFN